MMVIETLAKLQKHLGETVTIKGTYKQINGAQRPGKYVASGRASIILSDGHAIALGTQSAGIRSKEELDEMEGKKVSASGLYMGMQTLWGDGSEASIVAHALLGVGSVTLAE